MPKKKAREAKGGKKKKMKPFKFVVHGFEGVSAPHNTFAFRVKSVAAAYRHVIDNYICPPGSLTGEYHGWRPQTASLTHGNGAKIQDWSKQRGWIFVPGKKRKCSLYENYHVKRGEKDRVH